MKKRLIIVVVVVASIAIFALLVVSMPESKAEQYCADVRGIAERNDLRQATPDEIEEMSSGTDRVVCAYASNMIDDEMWQSLGREYAKLQPVGDGFVPKLAALMDTGSQAGMYKDAEDEEYRVTVRLLLSIETGFEEPRLKYVYFAVETNRPNTADGLRGLWERLTSR